MDTIRICMGSSCFGRGNSSIVEVVTRFIEDHQLQDRLDVTGSLCMSGENTGSKDSICALGPNIKINDKLISGVTAENISGIMARELGIAL